MEHRFALITANAAADWQAGRLAAALGAVGAVEVLDPAQLRLVCGRAGGKDLLLVLVDGRDARRFSAAVLARIAGPGADADVQLDAGRALELCGVPCLNRVGPMLAAQDKLWTAAVLAKAGIPTPLCSSVPRAVDALVASTELGSAVAKPLFGSLGQGLYRCVDDRQLARLARQVRREPVVLQRFVAPGGVDYRLFVVGDRVEACVRREAAQGEWRSNVARGARMLPAVASRAWRALALESARALGLEIAGVDLVEGDEGPLVLEVNGVPHFRGIQRATGRDMAEAIAARALNLAVAARTPRRRTATRRTAAGAQGRRAAAGRA